MAVVWESTSLSLGIVPLLLDEGQLEFVTVMSSSSDADEFWCSGASLCIGPSEHSSFMPKTLSFIRLGKYEAGDWLCCAGDSFAWYASIFWSTRSRTQEVAGSISFRSAQSNGVDLVGDGGGARGEYSLEQVRSSIESLPCSGKRTQGSRREPYEEDRIGN